MYAIDKAIYVLAGLPRSGSTLLMNILGQNPRFHVTPTSALIGALLQLRAGLDQNEALRALPEPERDAQRLGMLRGVVNGAFAHSDRPVAIDKNRVWPEYLELLEALLGDRDRVKVLITVRDLRDVLASFEKRHRATAGLAPPPLEKSAPEQARQASGRLRLWVSDSHPVGRAYVAIRDAVTRGWRDRLHFIEYDALTRSPDTVLHDLYAFLDEAPFAHDLARVEQITMEDDSVHGYAGLHSIRPVVAPQPPLWPTVYDAAVTRDPIWAHAEKNALFWRQWTTPGSAPGPATLAPPE